MSLLPVKCVSLSLILFFFFFQAEDGIRDSSVTGVQTLFRSPVKMTISTDDRPGMLNQLTSVLFAEQCNIRSLEARGDDRRNGEGAVIDMTVEIKDKKQLERVVSSIRRISGVRDVERTQ